MTWVRSSMRCALAAAALAVLGCSDLTHYPPGSPPLPGRGSGTSAQPTPAPDAGSKSDDGGVVGDSGTAGGDSGTVGTDGGTAVGDAGTLGGDSGTLGDDAGALGGDAGTGLGF
jgi:hypothetical protein